MDHLKKLQKELDKYAMSQPEFVKACDKYGLPPGTVLGGILGVAILIGVITQGYNIICALITCVYPMVQSIKCIQKEHGDATTKWLSFWTVFGLFQTVEMFIGFILAYIPYYSIVRIVFFVYLQAPQTNGAMVLYKSVFQPFLKQHEKDIQRLVEQVQAKADEAKDDLVKGVKDSVNTDSMLKAASKVSEMTKEKDPQESEKPGADE